jgi:hypothetical protein
MLDAALSCLLCIFFSTSEMLGIRGHFARLCIFVQLKMTEIEGNTV